MSRPACPVSRPACPVRTLTSKRLIVVIGTTVATCPDFGAHFSMQEGFAPMSEVTARCARTRAAAGCYTRWATKKSKEWRLRLQ